MLGMCCVIDWHGNVGHVLCYWLAWKGWACIVLLTGMERRHWGSGFIRNLRHDVGNRRDDFWESGHRFKIILKWILKGVIKMWTAFCGSGYGRVVGSCKCGKELSVQWKAGKFLTNLVALSFSRNVLDAVCCVFWPADWVPSKRRWLSEQPAFCHNSIDRSLKAVCVLFNTHCINLHYVLHGPVHSILSLCFVRCMF
jgi:hypothetical protein